MSTHRRNVLIGSTGLVMGAGIGVQQNVRFPGAFDEIVHPISLRF